MPTTQIKLDKPMQLPTPRTPKGHYPFKLLEIGDSFAVPIAEVSRAASASYNSRRFEDMQLRRFTRRQDKEAGTVRFWRIQ